MSDGVSASGCRLCPRNCGVVRAAGEKGFCGTEDKVLLARAALHHWEEPPLSGTRGSGTVFFSGCALRCAFCQNRQISRGGRGRPVTQAELAATMCDLEAQGAHNINLVTPTHFSTQIIAAVAEARAAGLTVPVVYNTSGYETVAAVERLAGTVDVFLTDFKYHDPELARELSGAARYPEAALQALAAMLKLTGSYREDTDGLAQSGVIVRHLALPGCIEDSRAALADVFALCGNRVRYSIMSQYTPPGLGSLRANELAQWQKLLEKRPELAAPLDREDYESLIDYAIDLGIDDAFIQEEGTASESFIPAF